MQMPSMPVALPVRMEPQPAKVRSRALMLCARPDAVVESLEPELLVIVELPPGGEHRALMLVCEWHRYSRTVPKRRLRHTESVSQRRTRRGTDNLGRWYGHFKGKARLHWMACIVPSRSGPRTSTAVCRDDSEPAVGRRGLLLAVLHTCDLIHGCETQEAPC